MIVYWLVRCVIIARGKWSWQYYGIGGCYPLLYSKLYSRSLGHGAKSDSVCGLLERQLYTGIEDTVSIFALVVESAI